MVDQLNGTLFDNGPKPFFCMHRVLKIWLKIQFALLPAILPAHYVRSGGLLLFWANCRHAQRSMTMWLSLLSPSQLMRNHMDLNVLEETKRFPRGE